MPKSNSTGPEGLSRREREVLKRLDEDLTNKEIGRALFVSEFTIKTHVQKILLKLNLPNRRAAARWWRQQLGSDDNGSGGLPA